MCPTEGPWCLFPQPGTSSHRACFISRLGGSLVTSPVSPGDGRLPEGRLPEVWHGARHMMRACGALNERVKEQMRKEGGVARLPALWPPCSAQEPWRPEPTWPALQRGLLGSGMGGVGTESEG